MSERVYIFDTTLRDGEQSPGCSMTTPEKLEVAKNLVEMGVDLLEAGFPIASVGDYEAVQAVSREFPEARVAALARAVPRDIDRALDALDKAKKPRLHCFIATSEIHLKYKLHMTEEEVLEAAVKGVEQARRHVDDVEFSAEDGSRTSLDYLCRISKAAVDAGATTINIPDTVGFMVPEEYAEMIGRVVEAVGDRAIVSVHTHNDLGLAAANALAAVMVGARQIECTINGIGERAGNASLEEIVMMLRTRGSILPFYTDIVSEELYAASRMLVNLTGSFVQANKAIVGKNAFAHEAGIHQDGMLKNAQTYEIMTPQSVGLKSSSLVLGKHSGRHALLRKYQDLGYELSRDELHRAYFFFTKLADQKKEIFDEDLITIIQDGIKTIPDTYKLKYVHAQGGNQQLASAVVQLLQGDDEFVATAHGDGPIDAIYKAIDRITGISGRLLKYNVSAVSRGKDALGEVFVRTRFGGIGYTGKAASVDVIDASARAYLNAVNKALYEAGRLEREAPRSASA